MIAFFVDLRVAIDSVDRETLVEAMRRKRIREGIVVRCEDILRKTRNKVWAGGNWGQVFWTGI